ncbi:MAG TPA: metallophosphoesterase [Vicinamibacteria bacterium]|nr:metallophosphoesterase [Vicinamibacteria bacterium]
MGRRIFVGDIQGCRQELERLLEAVRFDPASDRLEPTGDLVNRGPDSLGTLRLLRSLGAVGVLGNHDLHLLRVAIGQDPVLKKDTFQDVLADPDREDLLAWLGARPLIRAFPDAILVHAGLHPGWDDPVQKLAGLDPLQPHADLEFATSVRYCTAQGDRPERDFPSPAFPFEPWFAHLTPGRTIVFGHWARLGLLRRHGLRGLDTGCVWGGSLTAWIAEEDRIVQVPAARTYAPSPSARE